MHYSLARFACAAALVFMIISGCSMQNSYVSIEKKQFSDDRIYVEIPRFENLSDSKFEKTANDSYSRSVEAWIDSFAKENPEEDERSFELKQEIMRNKKPIVSIVGEAYVYNGGVHGSKSRIAKNIDVNKNAELQLADLFEDDAYKDALNRQMEKITEDNPEQYHDLWEKPVLSAINNEFFYLTDRELVIFYPPYELSYYAKGFVEFRIPYSDIMSYLKQEYKGL